MTSLKQGRSQHPTYILELVAYFPVHSIIFQEQSLNKQNTDLIVADIVMAKSQGRIVWREKTTRGVVIIH